MKVNKTVIAASKVIFYVNYFKIVEHHKQKKKKEVSIAPFYYQWYIYISQKTMSTNKLGKKAAFNITDGNINIIA